MKNINVCKILFILCSLRPSISKEVSPVRSYSKPEQSLDYRPRQSPTFTRQDAKTWKDKSWSVRLQKEMEGKIRQRRRSYSFSSSVEKGIKKRN